MMKKHSFLFASFNISFPPATTTAVDRKTGKLKILERMRFRASPNKAKFTAVL